MKTVWAVVFGNYSPPEVDSLWETKQQAMKAAQKANVTNSIPATTTFDWCVLEMEVKGGDAE